MQSVAHGADFVSFFRWRTCSFGTEIYWHGLNDYSNRPNRRLEELSLVKADFEAIKDIAGHPYEAAVAFYVTMTMSGMDKRMYGMVRLETSAQMDGFVLCRKAYSIDLWI